MSPSHYRQLDNHTEVKLSMVIVSQIEMLLYESGVIVFTPDGFL